jgi:hypothetical protein
MKKEYELPEQFLEDEESFWSRLGRRLFSKDVEFIRFECERAKKIVSTFMLLTAEELDEMTMAAAYGEIRLPHTIPPILNEYPHVVIRLGFFESSRYSTAFFTLLSSSLFYECTEGNIEPRTGKRMAKKIEQLFQGTLHTAYDGVFSKQFKSALQEKSDSFPPNQQIEIDPDLLSILDHPQNVSQTFNQYLDRLGEKYGTVHVERI